MSKTSNQPMWPIRKIFALEGALARRERDAVPLAQVAQQRGAVDALGRADRGDDRGGVVVGREQLEPHRLDAGARRAAEPDVALERGLEAVVEDHPERDVEPADQRDGRREGGVEDLLRLPRRAPVEVELRDGGSLSQSGSATLAIARPGGHISAFCEPETTTSMPQASVSSGTAPSEETASTTSDRRRRRRP